jgi:hypothetical protein
MSRKAIAQILAESRDETDVAQDVELAKKRATCKCLPTGRKFSGYVYCVDCGKPWIEKSVLKGD